MNKIKKYIIGISVGTINIMLGSGGGILMVPIYKKNGMSQKEAQINAIATMLPITFVSAIIYLLNGNVNFGNCLIFVLPGLIGCILGTYIIKFLPDRLLNIIFSLFIIWSGIRMIMR